MICDKCLMEHYIPRLRNEEISILEFLYNQKIFVAQIAMKPDDIADRIELTRHKCYMAIIRLECYNLIEHQPWCKNNFFINDVGIKALNILINKMEV